MTKRPKRPTTINGYLIDPERQCVEVVDLDAEDPLARTRDLIGARGLDHSIISDMRDSIWVDEHGLLNGKPIYAFKLPVQRDPYAGKAVIIGTDERGAPQAPHIPLEIIREHADWLGLIVPDVVWIEEPTGTRAVVTYSRPKEAMQ
jgi:hypothetical protein